MRLSSTRDLTRRVSSAQIPPLPPGSADGDAQPASAENLRAQSQSFTGVSSAFALRASKAFMKYCYLLSSMTYVGMTSAFSQHIECGLVVL